MQKYAFKQHCENNFGKSIINQLRCEFIQQVNRKISDILFAECYNYFEMEFDRYATNSSAALHFSMTASLYLCPFDDKELDMQ